MSDPKDSLPDLIADVDKAIQVPKVPGPESIRGRYLRTFLTTDEKQLYDDLWKEIMTAHVEDYTTPEDLMDVHMVCVESVLQCRLLVVQANTPAKYDARAFHESFNRLNKARENLASRRSDRQPGKKGGTTINIAVMAGMADIETQKKIAADRAIAQDDFFARTTSDAGSVEERLRQHDPRALLEEVIDAEFEEAPTESPEQT